VIRGIQTGLEFFRSRRRNRRSDGPHSSSPASDLPDENLFI
jgi:hypothetical protein